VAIVIASKHEQELSPSRLLDVDFPIRRNTIFDVLAINGVIPAVTIVLLVFF